MKRTNGLLTRRIKISGLLGLSLLALSEGVYGSCSFNSGYTTSTITVDIPPLVVNQDAEPGTVLFPSGILNGNATILTCTGPGDIYQGYTTALPVTSIKNVYQTNVQGIGIRAAWVHKPETDITEENTIIPWHKGVSVTNQPYPLALKAQVDIVVTGPVASGVLDTSRLQANWQYDNIVMGQLRFTSASVNVTANTCTLTERAITVPLKMIGVSDLDSGLSNIVSDDNFKIQLDNCAAGIKVDYMFTSAGSTGVSGSAKDILNIASGAGAAEGVGIQILDQNNVVQQFDTEYVAFPQTTQGQSVTIPLKARYIKTGTVKAGAVNAVATFEVYYR